MGSEKLISNLDYLRDENQLSEYVEQFYFFLATAVQKQDAKLIHHLLAEYVREIFYSDNRMRLHQLLQAAESFMSHAEYKEYHALFYLVRGNVYHVSLDYENSIENYKRAISSAAEMKDFHVLAVALNNLTSAGTTERFEPEEKFQLTLMPSVFLSMMKGKFRRKQYMLLIQPLEIAIDSGKYVYAQRLFDALKEQVLKENIILREQRQLDLIQLRIYLKSKQYAAFFQALHDIESNGLNFQFDLQYLLYEYGIEAAKGLGDAALVEKYTTLSEQQEEMRVHTAQRMARYSIDVNELMQYMVSFEVLNKKAQRHITRGELPTYSVVMFHIEQQHLSEEEVKSLQHDMHSKLLPNLRSALFGCTMVSASKMLYVFKQTEAQIIDYLQQYIKPVIARHRESLQKEFRVIISYVQNDLYGYETFEHTLQYAYALLYYARYNGKEALLNV